MYAFSSVFSCFVITSISIFVKCLSKCMLERSLKNNICRLIDTCTICWNVENMNFQVMIFHSLPKFFDDVNTLAIDESDHLLHYKKVQQFHL